MNSWLITYAVHGLGLSYSELRALYHATFHSYLPWLESGLVDLGYVRHDKWGQWAQFPKNGRTLTRTRGVSTNVFELVIDAPHRLVVIERLYAHGFGSHTDEVRADFTRNNFTTNVSTFKSYPNPLELFKHILRRADI